MKIIIYIISFISLFELIKSYGRQYSDRRISFENVLDILQERYLGNMQDRKLTSIHNRDDGHISEMYQNSVDPNDRVNVELWNELNEKSMKEMPQINDYSDEYTAAYWLEWYLGIVQRFGQIGAHLSWNYETNITSENQKAISTQSILQLPFSRTTLPIIKKFNEYMKNSKNEDLKRIFGRAALATIHNNDDDVKMSSQLHAQLESIYSTAKVCELNDPTQCYTLTPYLERLMQIEKDYDRLVWAWKGWHNECGNKIRPVYLSYIDLLNKNIKENNYTDMAEYWIQDYEMGNTSEFENTIDKLFEDIMPLYKELHAYVRGRLCSKYPNRFDCNRAIPAHILGNMWAQTWHDRFDDFIAYPDAPLVNITQVLNDKKFSIDQMYLTAEEFFTSIGLYPMTPKFWARSLFEKPTDRDVVCHPSAADFNYHDDYRVKICTELNDDYFYTIHHEMGHIEYYMSYAEKQPYVYHGGANSGFHEAIGDTIGMYAISPTHLIKLGFLDENDVNSHYEINYLLRLALQKVAFLPFGYVMDKYRFLLFRDQIDRHNTLNTMWWALRVEHGGIMAAVQRDDEVNFDAGAKYHIPSNVPYLRYFIAHILQFQFYRAMCRLQGETTRIHMCDIYGNKEVGRRFKEMLQMGDSKPWEDILKALTGEDKLESGAILEFFEPLYQWLKAENLARGYPVGWM